MGTFQGQIAIVTGGSSGIGKALAHGLCAQGATVIIADIQVEAGQRVVQELSNAGGNASFAELNVTNPQAVQDLIDTTVATHGRLDLMFNNAGVGVSGEVRDLTLNDWNRTLDINVRGVVHGVHAAYQVMVKQGSGHIINVASLAGLTPASYGVPYCASKHAVVGLSTSLRVEARALGVKVSVVCPGFIQTPMLTDTPGVNLSKEGTDKIVKGLPKISAEKCAQIILRGVRRNKAIITMPISATLGWWLTRLSPGFSRFVAGIITKRMRATRLLPESSSASQNQNKPA
ncbi:MAG: SDR family oxidoreductase [Deltaproteobacteria bacterium]|nr:MAG: SDR family oxidoreductase [Deltaproteobacteria bacterium]